MTPTLVVVSGPPGAGQTTLVQKAALLLQSGVTTVAEAAFQDHVWRPRLEELRSLAEIRVVHGTVTAEAACARR